MRSFYFLTKYWLKLFRWQVRRGSTSLRWGPTLLRDTPSIFGNAMPKSGSHLIIQVLQGLTKLGPFVNPGFPPVNRFEDNSHLDKNKIIKNLEKMRPGDIRYGYLPARDPFMTAMLKPNRANVFIFRDPRDLIVSHVFYATDMHTGHGMHRYYTETLSTTEERINAAILGVQHPDSRLPSVSKRYKDNIAWLSIPEVFSIRFEDLILTPDKALGDLLDYLLMYDFHPKLSRDEAIRVLRDAIMPKKSGTFRKGSPGNWRDHFTDENKRIFKENTGDLLQQLGYENDANW